MKLEKDIKKKQDAALKNHEEQIQSGLQSKFRATANERLEKIK